MDNEQKKRVQRSIDLNYQELLQLESGQYPAWAKWPSRQLPESPSLADRRTYADWCMTSILRAILPTLPEALRKEAQACLDVRERIWSEEYMNSCIQARKQTRPDSLATAGGPVSVETA